MVHPNIYKRREWLKNKSDSGETLSVELTESAAMIFNCSTMTIRTDWQVIKRNGRVESSEVLDGGTTLTESIKSRVHARDGNACQYCELDAKDSYIFEHIVPAQWGGVSEAYNIVIACRSCNAKKGRSVWIPHNFFAIASNNPEWVRLVINLQHKKKEHHARRKTP